MKEKKICPYCKGTKFIGTGYTQKDRGGHRVLYPHTEPCYCEINRIINKNNSLLTPISDANPKDSLHVCKIYSTPKNGIEPNIWFYGDEELFLYIVKCRFLNGYLRKNYLILEGGNIVERYNVPDQSTKIWLTTSQLNIYDFLALMLTSTANYNSLKDCVAEVIKNRSRLLKPTWIYTKTKDHLKEGSDCKEYSVQIDPYIKKYIKISLGSLNSYKVYEGFEPKRSDITKKKREQEINDEAANG